MVGHNHPSFYRFLQCLQQEQSWTEGSLRQINLGIPVRRGVAPRRKEREQRIKNIVQNYDEFLNNGNELLYLENLSHYVQI